VRRLWAVASRWRRLIYGALALAVVSLVLALSVHPLSAVHAHFAKQSVISAALQGYDPKAFPRVAAKLMYRRDLQSAGSDLGSGSPDELIWVVAVSGNYGISPSFGCCSVPRDYPGHNTWGLAIFVDAGVAPKAREFEVSYHGDWPPFFDQLPDLASA